MRLSPSAIGARSPNVLREMGKPPTSVGMKCLFAACSTKAVRPALCEDRVGSPGLPLDSRGGPPAAGSRLRNAAWIVHFDNPSCRGHWETLELGSPYLIAKVRLRNG